MIELKNSKVKFTPEDVIFTHKMPDGKIVFLEKGYQKAKKGAGLEHIYYRHLNDFSRKSISKEEIPDVLMQAVSQNGENIVGKAGTANVYEIVHNGKKQHIAIDIGSNGYIVRANPVSSWK